jgi:hypothetical protein
MRGVLEHAVVQCYDGFGEPIECPPILPIWDHAADVRLAVLRLIMDEDMAIPRSWSGLREARRVVITIEYTPQEVKPNPKKGGKHVS